MDTDRNVDEYRKPIGNSKREQRLTASSRTPTRDQNQARRPKGGIATKAQSPDIKDSIEPAKGVSKPSYVKIGIPKYDIIKIRDPATRRLGLRFELQVPKIKEGVTPQMRIMSAYEQTVEEVDTKHQYLVVAAEPYDTVALRIPAMRIVEEEKLTYFDRDYKIFCVQLIFDNM